MGFSDNVTRYRLDNGLTVLVERNPSAPVVTAVTHVRAGYFDEPDEWVGIAHVLEHMFFKGTARRGVGEMARETQRLGGYVNAGTIYDKTVYYAVLPATPTAVAEAVDLQADALMHLTLDPGELSRELEVIVQEANRKLDSPPAVAGETLYELLFAQHRMRRWRIGREDGLRRLTAEALRTYYRTRYTPERTIVALIGDLDPDHAWEVAEAAYGGWEGVADIDPSPPETDPPPPQARTLRGDIERPIVNLGWRTVDALNPDATALDAAAAVLGRGRGSWLGRAVRNPGLASSARAGHYTPTEVGVFQVNLEGEAARARDAVERALGLVAALAERGPAGSDLDRVRSLNATQWARRLESMEGRATLFAECEALGDYALVDDFYDRAMRVTPEEVRAAAVRYLNPDAAGSVWYFPENGSAPATADWPFGRRPHAPEPFAPSQLATSGATPSRDVRREPGDVVVGSAPGVDVVARSKPGAGLVSVGVYGAGLRAEEWSEVAGLSALFVRSAVRGAGSVDAEGLAALAEGMGGSLAPVVTADVVGWTMTVRPEAAVSAARLLRMVAADATLDGNEVDVERRLQASDAARVRDDMYRYPMRKVLSLAFPDAAFGRPVLGEPETVRNLANDLVRAWAVRFRSRRLTVVVVGDLDPEQLVDAMHPLRDWPATDATPAPPAPPRWQTAHAAEERQKAQSALAMAFPCAPYGSPDRFPLMVAGSLLSGLAGRLFVALREKRSLAYTVAASPWFKRETGAVLAYIATAPEREDEARERMLAELAALGTGEVPPEELERACNYAAGAIQLRQQSAHAIAGDVLEGWINGDIASLPDRPARLRGVSADDVRRVACEVFGRDTRAEFVVRGGSLGA